MAAEGFSEELPGGGQRAGLGRETILGEETVLVCDDAVDEDDLLRHLTHVGDARILLRLLHDLHYGLLHGPLLFLLRIQRERQKER